ncbi:MAG: hypothetical protein B6U78_00720 [Candidatus Aenigmarchaeota archaeon ex4484_224]|nr:MAG: hypothetical protein B6U78_00720 [Candidatus Aenigmarchaeota archaeon ex4484_224]
MASKLSKENLKNFLIFVISLNLLAIPLYIAIYFDFSIPALQSLISYLVSKILEFYGYKCLLFNNLIQIFKNSNSFFVYISWDSTGWKSMYFIFSLILATPSISFKRKFEFIPIAIFIVFVGNLLRIFACSLILINLGENAFETVHSLLWAQGMIILVLTVWFLWLRVNSIKYRKMRRKHGRS